MAVPLNATAVYARHPTLERPFCQPNASQPAWTGLASLRRSDECVISGSSSNKGFSHIGLSTLDLDKTRDFYENVLGFKTVRFDAIEIRERHELLVKVRRVGGGIAAVNDPHNLPSDHQYLP